MYNQISSCISNLGLNEHVKLKWFSLLGDVIKPCYFISSLFIYGFWKDVCFALREKSVISQKINSFATFAHAWMDGKVGKEN